MNWRSRFGEIDIIALDPRGIMVFVEVKTRRTTRFGTPQEAVDGHKREAVRHTALQWLSDEGQRVEHHGVRFDVLAVRLAGDKVRCSHIRSAF